MRFAIETWAADYGSPVEDLEPDDYGHNVTLDVEIPTASWEPIAPGAAPLIDRVAFVDGVRRIDAQIWIATDTGSTLGVCASVGAGVVHCAPGRAEIGKTIIARGVFAPRSADPGANDGTEVDIVDADIVTSAGTYRFHPVRGSASEELYMGIHNAMTQLEAEVANESTPADLVVFDGPLRERHDPRGVGYIKTQHVQYLPPEHHRVLSELGVGQRTPLFEISGRGVTRRSWYQRLPTDADYALAGIVRCEVAPSADVDVDRRQADAVATLLPVFASEPHKDGRAPQNLYPIAGLEHRLRHLLGDQQLLERALRVSAARTAR